MKGTRTGYSLQKLPILLKNPSFKILGFWTKSEKKTRLFQQKWKLLSSRAWKTGRHRFNATSYLRIQKSFILSRHLLFPPFIRR